VLSFPSQIVHKVHAEANKKAILLTLLKVADGQIPVSQGHTAVSQVIPKNAPPQLRHRLEQAFHGYSQLVDTFLNREKPIGFEEVIITKSSEFMLDGNLGLLKRLVKTYRQPLRIRMVELSDTYLTLKLNEIDTTTYFLDESQ
jgi:hypothetical protein